MSSFPEYEQYDGVGLAELVRKGEVSAVELVEAAIDRIERLNPRLNAVVVKNYDRARSLAASNPRNGPFAGVPFLTKDLAMVAGDLTSFGSVFFREFRPEVTDEYQKRAAAAGLISLGRTSSPEFGLLPTTESTLHGPTRNPWDPEYSSGGSSGGSAAATAARMVPMAHASDGGGSIRIPASACGVFGFKPTRGLMPRFPGSAADYLSVDLAVTRTVRDTAVLLDATCGAVPGSVYQTAAPLHPFSAAPESNPRPLRIAFSTVDHRGAVASDDTVAAVTDAADTLAGLGHQLVEASPAIDGQALAEAFIVVWESLAESIFTIIMAEASKQRAGALLKATLGEWRAMKVIASLDKRKSGKAAFEPFTWALADHSRRRTPAELEAAKSELQRVSHAVAAFLVDYDTLLTPVLGTPPVKIGRIDQEATWDEIIEHLFSYVAYTPVANFSGLPAMSVPTHWSKNDLPIGTHFLGRYDEDALLLSLAGQLERTMPWHDRMPNV